MKAGRALGVGEQDLEAARGAGRRRSAPSPARAGDSGHSSSSQRAAAERQRAQRPRRRGRRSRARARSRRPGRPRAGSRPRAAARRPARAPARGPPGRRPKPRLTCEVAAITRVPAGDRGGGHRRRSRRASAGRRRARGGCGRGGRSPPRMISPRVRMFRSIVVGTDGSETARKAVREAIELAAAVGASIELVSRLRAGRRRSGCARRRARRPRDLQWMVNPREDVEATLREAAEEIEAAGVPVHDLRPRGRPGRRDPRRRRGARRRPDRGRQQGHDRRQALPARLRAQQGLPPRALLAC